MSLAALSVLAVSVYAGPCHVQSSTGVIDPALSTPSESLPPTHIKTTPINTNSIIGTPGVSSPGESTSTTPVASNAETKTPSTTPSITPGTVPSSRIETASSTELVVTLISTPLESTTTTTTSEAPAVVKAILGFCLKVITPGKINTGHHVSGGSTSVIQRIFDATLRPVCFSTSTSANGALLCSNPNGEYTSGWVLQFSATGIDEPAGSIPQFYNQHIGGSYWYMCFWSFSGDPANTYELGAFFDTDYQREGYKS